MQNIKDRNLERMLTVQQVADLLQVCICSVRRWSDRGDLKFYRVGSRGDRRFWREDIFRFLEESSAQSGGHSTNH